MHELILGGARSGKSRTAEGRARAWLAGAPGRRALVVVTALAADAEMRARIERHRADRAARLPGVASVEAPQDLAGAIRRHSAPDCLLVVDCLTLWLSQWWLPPDGPAADAARWPQTAQALLDAIDSAPGPLVLVSNEIGLGVMPLGREARQVVDALGLLHQQVAARCGRATLMVAGRALALEEAA